MLALIKIRKFIKSIAISSKNEYICVLSPLCDYLKISEITSWKVKGSSINFSSDNIL